jgi:lysine 2,3-aminomutase
MKDDIHSLQELKARFALSKDEAAFKGGNESLPVSITSHYLSLIDPDDPDDPLRRQVFPNCKEEETENLETLDPLAEIDYSVTPRLVHRYRSRVAFLTTDICPMYCRHCFRRRFTGNMVGPASEKEIEEAAVYIGTHHEITEILLTGGDMFTLSDAKIDRMITIFREHSPKLIIRLCTRMIVTQPSRFSPSLITMLHRHSSAPFYLLTQFNHPREICEVSRKAVSLFVDAGIPAFNQTVLLKGVNDNADVMEQLCNDLLAVRVKPYYVFQGDLVSGTAHLRVPLSTSRALEREMRDRLSGLAMPNFMIDLPKGGGKVPITDSFVAGHDNGIWHFNTLDGSTRSYPD